MSVQLGTQQGFSKAVLVGGTEYADCGGVTSGGEDRV